MNKEKDIKNDRAKYVQKTVNESKKTGRAVNKLAKQLFLSKRTIYDDLSRDVE